MGVKPNTGVYLKRVVVCPRILGFEAQRSFGVAHAPNLKYKCHLLSLSSELRRAFVLKKD